MWSTASALSKQLLRCLELRNELKRNTYIFSRLYEPRMRRMNNLPKKIRRREYYYKLEEVTDHSRKHFIDVVLVRDVPGIGMTGDLINVDFFSGYHELLLPKLAIYASLPEAKSIIRTEIDKPCSSIHSKTVEKHLLANPVPILLNNEQKWVLQPWHVKVALSSVGIKTKDECILLPEKEISGPDPGIENRDFIVNINMNKSEVYPVRCRILHARKDQNIKSLKQMLFTPSEPLFPEDKEKIESMMKFQSKK